MSTPLPVNRVYFSINSYTHVDPIRLMQAYELGQKLFNLDNLTDILSCGVWSHFDLLVPDSDTPLNGVTLGGTTMLFLNNSLEEYGIFTFDGNVRPMPKHTHCKSKDHS